MKKTFIFLSLFFAVSILAGCSSNNPPQETAESPQDTVSQSQNPGNPPSVSDDGASPAPATPAEFLFVARGLTIGMGSRAAPIVEALGEPLNYFEAPSCAFEGIDRIYYYSGFELYTFPVDGEDFVLSVSLTDDSVTTDEGVYLGMSYDRMVAAYGEDFAKYIGQYTYTRGNSSLAFLIENDKIVSIIYKFTNTP